MIVTHLNAPYGPRVREEHVQAALCAGALSAIDDEVVRAIVATLFQECPPVLVARAAAEVGASLSTVQALYRDTIAAGEHPSRQWDEEMEWVS